jgi:Lon protease-like protein
LALSYTIPEYLDVPIFPLPNVTFFTQTYLPLHVFEDRYRALVANAIKGDRLIGVALLREGWHRDYFGSTSGLQDVRCGKNHRPCRAGRWPLPHGA